MNRHLFQRNLILRLLLHVVLLSFNFGLFFVLATTGGSDLSYAYLMLVSILAIAMLDSVLASVLYAGGIITAVSIFLFVSTNRLSSILFFDITTLSLSIASWLAANSFHRVQDRATALEEEQQSIVTELDQLRLSAELGQQILESANSSNLLHDIVYLIKDKFGHQFAAIFITSKSLPNVLDLRAATGKIGAEMVDSRVQVLSDESNLIGWVAQNKILRALPEVTAVSPATHPVRLSTTRSELIFPLISQNKLLGVLNIQNAEPNAFNDQNIATLQIVANQLASGLENSELLDEQRRQLTENETLFIVAEALADTHEVGEIFRRSALILIKQLDINRSVISSWQPKANTLTTEIEFVKDLATSEITDDRDNQIEIFDLANHQGSASLLKEGGYLLRQLNDPHLESSERDIIQSLDAFENLELAIMLEGKPIGTLELFRHESQPAFSQLTIRFVRTMLNNMSLALHNARAVSDARARTAQLSMLNRLSTALTVAPTLAAVFEGVRREILSLVEATGMSIMLLTPDKQQLHWRYGFEYGQEVDVSNFPPQPLTVGLSGYVVREQKPLLANRERLETMREELQSFQIGAVGQTWLGVPMIVTNEPIGVLVAENEQDENAFGEREVELLSTIAGPIAIAVNNLLQFEAVSQALEKQSQQRNLLQTAAAVAATATSVLEPKQLINEAVQLIKERFGLYYVGLFLLNADGTTAVLRAGTDEAGKIQVQQMHSLSVAGRSLIGGATADGKPRIIQDVQLNEEWRPNPHLPDTRSELALPLRVRKNTIGALTVQSTTPNAFDEDMVSILLTMCDQLSVAIANAQLLTNAEARARNQQQLNLISNKLHNTGDVQEIVSIGLQAIAERFPDQEIGLRLGKISTSSN